MLTNKVFPDGKLTVQDLLSAIQRGMDEGELTPDSTVEIYYQHPELDDFAAPMTGGLPVEIEASGGFLSIEELNGKGYSSRY